MRLSSKSLLIATAIICHFAVVGVIGAQTIPNPYADVLAADKEVPPYVKESPPQEKSPTESDGLLLTDELKSAAEHIQIGDCPPAPAEKEKPKYPTIIVTGVAQIDGIWFSQDEANRDVVGEARDDAGFRRARLGVKGDLTENVSYMMEYDFAFPGRPSFMDVYVDIADLFEVGHFRVGQWRQPLGLEALTSVRDLMFMERSLAFALVPFRQTGIGLYNTAFQEDATWAISGYRFPTDAFGDIAGDRGYGMSTRETFLIYYDECGNTIHLGGGYSWNAPSTHLLRIRSTPEVGFTQLDINNITDFPIPFFVNTGFLPTDDYQVANAEFAVGTGSLLFQAEYFYAVLNQFNGPSLNFPAMYAQLGYVLTGERREYNRQAGVYGRVVPKCPYGKAGNGAWEVATRYSMIDLNDADVQGGRLQDFTFGLNWYLNKFTRFEFNYIHPFLDRPVGNYTHADICAVRAQFDF